MSIKGFLTFNDGLGDCPKVPAFVPPYGGEGKEALLKQGNFVIKARGEKWHDEVPLVCDGWEFGVREEEIDLGQPKEYMFYFTRGHYPTSIAEIELKEDCLGWAYAGHSFHGATLYSPSACFAEEYLRKLIGEYNSNPNSKYTRTVRLCDRFRNRGFIALARVSDLRDPAGGYVDVEGKDHRRWQGGVYPIRNLTDEVTLISSGIEYPPGKEEVRFGSSGSAYLYGYRYRGLSAEVVTLYKNGQPFNPVRPLRHWRFLRKRVEPSTPLAQPSGNPRDVGLKPSALKMVIDLERPGIEGQYTRCCEALGLTRHAYLGNVIEAILENKDSAEEYKRYAARHTLLGNLTLELPEGSQIRLDEIDNELAEKYGFSKDQLDRLVDFAPQPAEGCIPWEVVEMAAGELPNLWDRTYAREYPRYWAGNGLRDLRSALAWRPRVKRDRRSILSLRQIVRLLEGGWGGAGHSGNFLYHEVTPRLALYFASKTLEIKKGQVESAHDEGNYWACGVSNFNREIHISKEESKDSPEKMGVVFLVKVGEIVHIWLNDKKIR